MKIIIAGSTPLAIEFAKYMSFDHTVCLINKNDKILKNIINEFDILPVYGDPQNLQSYDPIIRFKADLFYALTTEDSKNILSCYIAKNVLNIPKTFSSLNSLSYPKNFFSSFINDLIYPKHILANALSRSVETFGILNTFSLKDTNLKILGLICKKCPLLNTPLKLIGTILHSSQLVILWIFRNGKGFIPNQDDSLKENDEIYCLTKEEDLEFTLSLFGINATEKRKLLLIGGGKTGYHFLNKIQHSIDATIIIDHNIAKLENIAQNISHSVTTIHADALQSLNNLDFSDLEMVVSMTNDDRVNLLSSLLSKQRGAKRALCCLKDTQYLSFAHFFGIDGICNMQNEIISKLAKKTVSEFINFLYIFNEIEIAEVKIASEFSIVGFLVDEINIETEVMIAALIRDSQVYMLPKNLTIQAGDSIIFVCKKNIFSRIQKLLQ